MITLWTWETAELANLEANLAKLEKLAPKSRKLLGCYTASLDPKGTPRWTAMPVPVMQRQCETGLRWLREGRIDGIIIYGTAMDLGCRARLARLRGCRLRGRCGPVAATPS